MRIATRLAQRMMVFVAWTGLALLASIAHAERPMAAGSSEGICAGLAEATPGLESLCVNYCEARNCIDSDNPECDGLLENYDRHRRDGDPGMPCLLSCPCFTAADLRDHPADLTTCYQTSDGTFSAIADDLGISGAGSGYNPRGLYTCAYTLFDSDLMAFTMFDFRTTFPEEAVTCIDMIDAEIAARGFSCDLIY